MNRRAIVVGGGISGLAAAYHLMELRQERGLGLEITLLEAGQRLGGSIATERVGDFLVEAGPDSFITEKPWALRLCNRLGIQSRLVSTNSTGQTVYVVHNGSLQPLPEGFFLLAPTRFAPLIRTPLFSWRGKLRMAAELFLPRGHVDGDESLASFVRRRFGQEVLDRVAQPLIGGIYAADPERLSLRSTMPRFLDMERANRSVIYALWRGQRLRERNAPRGSGARWSLFVTLAGGMQELVETIAERFPAGTVRLNTGVSSLEREREPGEEGWLIATRGAEKLKADGIILAIPSYGSAEMLSPVAPELSRELAAIPYSSAATVSLAYRREQIPHRLDAFGIVVPNVEARQIIACTFSSLKYPGRAPGGHLLLRAFVGGALQPHLVDQDDSTIESCVRRELAELLGIQAAPLFCRIFRHRRSMPQYEVGHHERIRRINSYLTQLPPLSLAGNAYGGVGMADCIHSGEQAAEGLLERLK